jgi:TolB-like protein
VKHSVSDFQNDWQKTLTLFFGLLLLSGCGKPFMVEDFESTYKPRASLVAIAPFSNLSTEPEGERADDAIREEIYSEMVRHQKEFTVEIQDIAETDMILSRHNLSTEEAARLPGEDLCRLLGVDIVMKGSVFKYLSKGILEQAAEKAVFDTVTSASEIKAKLSIYDAQEGELVWQQDFEPKRTEPNSIDLLRQDVAWSAARSFPYRKKKIGIFREVTGF